jgi:acyl-CoA thioesterase
MLSASNIVNKMLDQDAMSKWLGISIVSADKGNVVLSMKVRQEMTNGFAIAHGGITYSLSDSCLAFSANSYGIQSVSVETSISHLKPVNIDDVLTTSVEEISITKRIGVYHISVKNQLGEAVSSMKGTMYRTGKIWE